MGALCAKGQKKERVFEDPNLQEEKEPEVIQPPESTSEESGDPGERFREDVDDIGVYGLHAEAPGTALLREKMDGKREVTDVNLLALARELHRCKQHDTITVNPPDLRFVDHVFLAVAARDALIAKVDAAAGKNATDNAGGIRRTQCDTVVEIALEDLVAFAGAETVAAMQAAFGSSIDRVKLRRVEASEKAEVINFHLDVAARTMGIALNSDTEYEGSRLVYATPERGLVTPRRTAGCATIHDCTVPHGVTPLVAGVRYGLFLLTDRGGA
jgi:hypothetical protein